MILSAMLVLLKYYSQYVIRFVANSGEKYEMYVSRNGDILCRVRMKYFTSSIVSRNITPVGNLLVGLSTSRELSNCFRPLKRRENHL